MKTKCVCCSLARSKHCCIYNTFGNFNLTWGGRKPGNTDFVHGRRHVRSGEAIIAGKVMLPDLFVSGGRWICHYRSNKEYYPCGWTKRGFSIHRIFYHGIVIPIMIDQNVKHKPTNVHKTFFRFF